MPYFVRIGKIETNKSGVGSRGWYARRRAKTIVVRWGSVDVVPAGSQLRFYWVLTARVLRRDLTVDVSRPLAA